EDGIRDLTVTGVQTCALPISAKSKTSPDKQRAHSSPATLSLLPSPPETSSCPEHSQPRKARPANRHVPKKVQEQIVTRAHAVNRSEERRVGKECRGGRAE